MSFRAKTVLCAGLAAFLLAGCGAMDWFRSGPPKADLGAIRVVAEPGANRNFSTSLDIVFVYDQTAAGMMPKTGPEWFTRKNELVNGMPDSLDVVSLQVPPSMVVEEVSLPKRYGKAIHVFAYANYLTKEGQYPGNLTTFRRAVIRLKPGSVQYSNG